MNEGMTEAQVIELFAVASAAYPRMQELTPNLMQAKIRLWTKLLGDLSPELAMGALQRHIAMSKYEPTVAEIRDHAAAIMPSEIPLAEAAWGELLQQIRKVGYIGTPTWSHPVIGETVRAMWGNWQGACAAVQVDTIAVDRAQFCRMFETMTKRHREDRLLPPAVRELTAKLAASVERPFRLGDQLAAPALTDATQEGGTP